MNEEVRTLIDLYYESDLVSKGHVDFFFDIETAKDEEGKYTEELTHTEIYEELKDKYDFLDMPLSEANKRFKKDREVIGPYSIKYQNNKINV